MDHFLKLEDHNSLPNSASPDTDDWHLHLASQSASRLRSSAPTGRRSCGRGDKEWPGLAAKVPVSKAKRNDKTTTSANTVVRIHGVAKETQSNQPGSREASSHTYALAGNSRRPQGDVPAVPCVSGYRDDGSRRHADVAKWKEMDPLVRDPFIISSSPRVLNQLSIISQCSIPPLVVSFFRFQ